MTNSSAFDVRIKVDDVLPSPSTTSDYIFKKAVIGGTTITNMNNLKNQIIKNSINQNE